MRSLLAGLAGLVTAITSVPDPSEADTNRWGAGYFPDTPVVTQDGKVLHFYGDLIKGRTVVVSFFYTSCTTLCSIETARLAEVKSFPAGKARSYPNSSAPGRRGAPRSVGSEHPDTASPL